jgi:hypothetical protein
VARTFSNGDAWTLIRGVACECYGCWDMAGLFTRVYEGGTSECALCIGSAFGEEGTAVQWPLYGTGNDTETVIDFNVTFKAPTKDVFSAQRCAFWQSGALASRRGEPVSYITGYVFLCI